ncbi:MAG: amino acid permease [Coxiellaceae bacterium]|jgi:amino acid transporter|nr:amino acid permease [Coxiellaceae bacterium]
MQNKSKLPMSILSLVMINVIAICSLRNVAIGATYGFSLLSYYAIFTLTFFIPSALVSAELTTGWPQSGGVYIWVREAFGKPMAFVVICIQWIYNICWYPTILSLMAATLAYIINPNLVNNIWYMLGVISGTYWLITIITLRGMHISSMLSTITAVIGTLIPMGLIAILGIIWLLQGRQVSMNISLSALIPDIRFDNLALLTGVVYGLLGMEMSAVHVQDVKNPSRDYPRALYYSTIIILLAIIPASLAVAVVVPKEQLNLITGLLDAFALFFKALHLNWLQSVIAILMIVGVIGGVGAWTIGPARGLLVAAADGCIPNFFQQININKMPKTILIMQGIIFSIVCLVFLVMPSVNSSFWILADLTAMLALSCYVFIFASAIRLRYKYPTVKRVYKIPFGNFGMWFVGSLGIATSVFIILIGFIPPKQIIIGSVKLYEIFLITGFAGFYLVPLIIYRFQQK